MLYKYSPINDYLKASLTEQYVWFSPPSSFNDINDSNLRLDHRYTEEEIRQEFGFIQHQIYRTAMMQQDYSSKPQHQEAVAQSFFSSVLADRGPDGRPDHSGRLHASVEESLDHRRQTIGISCYSQESHNELLWAHYADAHYGVCLGVEPTFDHECFQQLERVKYVDVLPNVKLLSHMGRNLVEYYTTKSSPWSYEREVRAFQHVCGRHRMDPRCLVNVIFGLRARESDIDETCSLVRKKYGQQVTLLQVNRGEDGTLVFRDL
jgi:Protein of unknown function (DUF2971)